MKYHCPICGTHYSEGCGPDCQFRYFEGVEFDELLKTEGLEEDDTEGLEEDDTEGIEEDDETEE